MEANSCKRLRVGCISTSGELRKQITFSSLALAPHPALLDHDTAPLSRPHCEEVDPMNTGFPATFVRPSRRWTIVMTVLLLALPVLAQVSVLTHHNDNTRTGANLNETILTPSNVNVNQFGMLFKHVMYHQVYNHPLVATNATISGTPPNLSYITTVGNSVYAFSPNKPKLTAPS